MTAQLDLLADLPVCVLPACSSHVDQQGDACASCLTAFGPWLKRNPDAAPTVGALFAGYGGLELAVAEAIPGTRLLWVSEHEPATKRNNRPSQAAARVLAYRWPTVPNLGDIANVVWPGVPPVDILTGGFPCTDVSVAGLRAGLGQGTRSGLWSRMADAIRALRPRLVVIENVRGLLSARADSDVEPCPWCLGETGDQEPALRALGAVLADLAELGYDAAWHGLRASDVGAPHGRFRVFILAWPADPDPSGRRPHLDDVSSREPDARRLADADADGAPRDLARVTLGGGGSATHRGRGPAQPRGRDRAVADAHDERGEGRAPGRAGGRRPEPADGGSSAAADAGRDPWPPHDPHGPAAARRGHALPDATSNGRRARRPEPARVEGGPCTPVGGAAADPDGEPLGDEPESEPRGIGPAIAGYPRASAAPHARDDRCEGHAEPDGRAPSRVDGEHRGHADGRALPASDWGAYGDAVHRWERIIERVAPAPTEPGSKGQPRLSPWFVEWMMGLPEGWVCGVPGLSRNDKLRILGNGVVPQQGAAAFRILLPYVPGWRWAA